MSRAVFTAKIMDSILLTNIVRKTMVKMAKIG